MEGKVIFGKLLTFVPQDITRGFKFWAWKRNHNTTEKADYEQNLYKNGLKKRDVQ